MSTERVKWTCPGCENLYSVRKTEGLTLCPECKRKKAFTLEEAPHKPARQEATDLPVTQMLARTEPVTETSDEQLVTEIPQKPFIDFASVAVSSPPIKSNYRNLNRVLKLLELASQIILGLAIIAAVISLIVNYVFIFYAVTTPDELRHWQAIPVQFRVLIPFLPVVQASLMIFFGWVIYILLMANVEFVRVIVDIETNTRREEL